jgi:hypothetical protein
VSEGRPGLELRQPPRIQQLPAGGYLNVVLPEPGRYTVVAVCDGECDVDLWAFGSNGRSVGREVERPAPILEVEVSAGRPLRLRADLVECAAQACHAALGVFAAK